MKKWRRRGGIGPPAAGLSGCALADLGGGLFEATWNWAGADPDEFRLSFSVDHGINFEIIGPPFEPGNARSSVLDVAGLEGQPYMISIVSKVGGVTTSTCITNELTVPP